MSDEEILEAIRNKTYFGASYIQRLTGWRYNRSAEKVEELLISGQIIAVKNRPHRFKIKLDYPA